MTYSNTRRIANATIERTILVFVVMSLGLASGKANTTQYMYDNSYRLTKVVYDNGMQITYAYDEAGNRTRRVSTLQADTSIDGTVNFEDFAILASRWLDEDCSYFDEWCEGADIDWSSEVDIEDLAFLAQQWLESTD